MASNPTVHADQSLAKHHVVHIANHAGKLARVASSVSYNSTADETTIPIDDSGILSGDSLYSSSTPGMVVVIDGQASGDEGKTADIESADFSAPEVVAEGDLSSELADGDVIAIIPPMASELITNGGHGIQTGRNFDDAMGLGEEFLRHNTALQIDPSGPLPVFLNAKSEAVARILLAGTGAYFKSGTGEHKFRPFGVDDGNFTERPHFSMYSQEGNGVVKQVFPTMFGRQLTLNFPETGVANISLDTVGSAIVREVGGTGKTFPSGSNAWDRGDDIERDGGDRHVYKGTFVDIGGSFGDALTDDGDRYFAEATVQITRDTPDDFPLGSQERAVAEEVSQAIQVTGTRLHEDATVYQDHFGSSTAATPGAQTETRLLVKGIYPADTARVLDVDIPRGVWRIDDIQRNDGRFREQFTFVGMQTKDSNNHPDSANPLYEILMDNNQDIDLLSAL